MTNDYPKMLYRHGSMINFEGKNLDWITVSNLKDEREKLATGWAESPGKLGLKTKGTFKFLEKISASIKKYFNKINRN